MTRVLRFTPSILLIAAIPSVRAQQPSQFKAAVKMKNGADGSTATGTMYFGGAKMRTELTMDGQNVIVLADPAAKSQYVLMPSEKVYMQMPIGQGPVSMPITGPSDPTNPCGGASGNTDCVKGPNESVNGYDAVRWDYTSAEGVRTRAWVSTKLRFPVKSQDDNGSSMEFSNIAEGPQAASLFGIPAGYKKMDIGAMGGMGAGRGNATQSGNPMAAAMANLPPEAQAAMAAAMRGGPPKAAPRAATGSAWERGNGWVLAVTITATQDSTTNKPILGDVPAEGHSTFSMTTRLSIPLNSVAPAAGVPGTPGPMWSHAAGAPGLGSAAAEKLPISGSTTTESRSTLTWKGDCSVLDPGTRTTTMKGSGDVSVPLTQMRPEMMVQAMFKLSADLKTYDLLIGASGPSVKEVVQTHEETGATCRGKPTIKDNTETKQGAYGLPTTEFTGMPLPSAVGPVTGSKKVRLRFANQNKELDATVSWTLTPIR